MQIRYSTNPFLELEFLGNRTDFMELAQVLAQGDGEIEAKNQREPAPYLHFWSRIVIEQARGEKVAVTLSNRIIIIRGDRQWLNHLAGEMRSLSEEAKPPYHAHIEYYTDHFYLAPNSFPLVCSLRQ